MLPLRVGRTTPILLAFLAGFFIARATPTPAAHEHEDGQTFVPAVAQAVEPAAVEHVQLPARVHLLSFDAKSSINASVLESTPIAMQPVLGASGDAAPNNADTTSSIAENSADSAPEVPAPAPAINPLRKPLLVAAAGPIASFAVEPSAQDPNQAILDKPSDAAAPEQGAERPAAAGTRLALATPGPTQDLTPDVTKRQADADALPPIIIGHTRDDHDGGDIDVFAKRYEKIKKSGRRVVIDGLCFSACTIVASLPKDQVCVTPKASLAVHMATTDDGRPDVEYTQKAVKKYYPQTLQDWIKKHGGLRTEPKYVKGDDLLTIFNPCKKGTGA
jgi:hypothetical protein